MTTPEHENRQQDEQPDEHMKAMPEERLNREPARTGGFPLRPALIVLVLIVGLVLLFYPRGDDLPPEQDTPVAPQAANPEPAALPPAENIPKQERPEPEAIAEDAAEGAPQESPLPSPENSDPVMREQLAAVGAGAELSGFEQGDNLVQRLVALVDGGSRGVLLRKILPMEAPSQPFPVESIDGQLYMSPAGYERYDSYVDAVVALDTEVAVKSFHQLRPLYEEAYRQLGLKAEDLDNAVIRTLDRIIATPEIEDPIALESKTVMYSYADPKLQALPPIQRQLLRMGPDNIRRIKQQARALRSGLLEP